MFDLILFTPLSGSWDKGNITHKLFADSIRAMKYWNTCKNKEESHLWTHHKGTETVFQYLRRAIRHASEGNIFWVDHITLSNILNNTLLWELWPTNWRQYIYYNLWTRKAFFPIPLYVASDRLTWFRHLNDCLSAQGNFHLLLIDTECTVQDKLQSQPKKVKF